MIRKKIFISSVQAEFAQEREMLCRYIRTDVLLGKFFEPFIFEEVAANDNTVEKVYIKEVERCDIYLGIYGTLYGYQDSEGISPTEREYDLATQLHKTRLIFIKNIDEENRHPKEVEFIEKVERNIVRKAFVDEEGLCASVYASLIRYLEEKEYIRYRPFDASYDNGATLEDLDEDRMRNFIHMARSKRNFSLSVDTSPKTLLSHLNLMDENGRLANAALLLFGKKPQKFFTTSEVKCVQFYGNKVEKPMPAYQVYKGDVFELINQATSFVMSRIDNWTGIRSGSDNAAVETRPELPIDAVKEAIVNAVCHRDYTSNASVQVMLFRNRLEVCNPGSLPYGLTVEKLHKPHNSMPTNPLLAEPMYWNGYIEKLGTGTGDIIGKCSAYGLQKPEFHQDEDFRVVLWRRVNEEDEEEKQSVPDIGQSVPDMGQTVPDTTQTTNSVGNNKGVDKQDVNTVNNGVPDIGKSVPDTGQSVPEVEQVLLGLIRENPEISRAKLGEKLQVSERQIRKIINKLRSEGKITRIGGDYKGKWAVVGEIHKVKTPNKTK